VPVLQPLKAREENFQAELRALQPELIAVAAFGQILPKASSDLPRLGCLNVHTSLLPKYRGASPIQSAILNGETETGVTIMKMDVGLDTGDILTQRATPISADDNAATLHDRLAQLGGGIARPNHSGLRRRKIQSQPAKHELATHVAKIKKEDGRIDWSQPARAIWNRIRAFTPWPGAFTFLPTATQAAALEDLAGGSFPANGNPRPILSRGQKPALSIGCGENALRLTSAPTRRRAPHDGGRISGRTSVETGHEAWRIKSRARPSALEQAYEVWRARP
jgi:methionyl-tRNA formyltransferase